MKNTPRNPNSWYEDAYRDVEHRYVQWELVFGPDVIRPGTKIKIKQNRGTFLFRCLVHNSKQDISWIDCIDAITREYRSFYVGDIKGLVKMKSRRRKVNV